MQIIHYEWSLLGFLKYRKEQDDFSGIKDKEHYRYKMSLHLYDKFTIVERMKAQHCLDNFKVSLIVKHRKEESFGKVDLLKVS